MRLAVVGFGHEANSFAPESATPSVWEAGMIEGDQIRQHHGASESILAGFFAYGDSAPDVELIPLTYGWITPTGESTEEAFEFLAGKLVRQLRKNGPWDGVLLPQHGAAVAANHLDADGEFLRRVRAVVGPSVPIGVTLDMHANLSRRMIEHADVITVYQTNPHVDAREQGFTCARLVGQMVRGEIRPVMALADPPLAIGILRQGTDDEPMRSLLDLARAHETRPGMLSVSVLEGFPYADVPEMGMSILAVADGEETLAAEVARTLAMSAWQARADFIGDATNIDDALQRARANSGGPVVLMDMGDNVGGGSPGDSTHILHSARRLGVRGLAQCLYDPAVAGVCVSAGVGARITASVGGKVDGRHGTPFPVSGEVIAVTDGRFDDPTSTHGGTRRFDLGPSAGLRTDDGYFLAIHTRPEGTWSQLQFRTVGIEPAETPIVVVKGVHAPRAAFQPIASQLIWVDTPGSTSADLSTLDHRQRRRPMFPFEPDAQYTLGTAA